MSAVAIDGPAGAGKSTVARAVAEVLGFRYLDTGAMYRAVALAAMERGIDVDDEAAMERLVQEVSIEMRDGAVFVDGRDVSGSLRGRDVSATAARVATHGSVRSALVTLQRQMASAGDVVMEGRDIGTAVLPEAEAKIFLTASLTERAMRRCKQLGLSQDASTLADVGADIDRRDRRDTSRSASPLVQADDAIVVDTTGMALEEVVQRIAEIARRAIGTES